MIWQQSTATLANWVMVGLGVQVVAIIALACYILLKRKP